MIKKNIILFISLLLLVLQLGAILIFGFSMTSSKSIKVHFDTAGGTPLDSLVLSQGERIDFKLEVAKDGYEFEGWYIDEDYNYLYDFSNTLESDLTLYAKWEAIGDNYTIIWVNWDGQILQIDENMHSDSIHKYNGSDPLKPSDEQYVYEFINWVYNLDELTGDVIYIAIFETHLKSFTVTFMSGEDIIDIQEITYGQDATPPILFSTPEYYYLEAWNQDITYITQDITVYPILKSVFEFEIIDNEITILNYQDLYFYTTIEIPSQIDGYPVCRLSYHMFEDIDTVITNLIIPESVEFIEMGALYNLGYLQEITIPYVGSTIDNETPAESYFNYIFGNIAFEGAQIFDAFYSNNYSPTYLKKVTITSGNKIGKRAFLGLGNLEEVIFPESLTTIEDYAFQNTKLLSLSIPESVSIIGAYAFASLYELITLEIHSRILNLGTQVFNRNEKMVSVTFNEFISLDAIPYGTFQEATALRSIVIPNSVTIIEQSAFAETTNLQNVFLPTNLTVIEPYAFRFSGLIAVSIPSGVKVISDQAFANCYSLSTVLLKSGLERLETYVFSGCINLRSIFIPSTVTTIADHAFSKTGLSSILITANTLNIETNVFEDCYNQLNIYTDALSKLVGWKFPDEQVTFHFGSIL